MRDVIHPTPRTKDRNYHSGRDLPASAGLHPGRTSAPHHFRGSPRERGATPARRGELAALVGISPRARGYTDSAKNRATSAHDLPASAGLHLLPKPGATVCCSPPRERGATPSAYSQLKGGVVDSPRERGATPSGEGKSTSMAAISPRTRSYTAALIRAGIRSQLSPRARGYTIPYLGFPRRPYALPASAGLHLAPFH